MQSDVIRFFRELRKKKKEEKMHRIKKLTAVLLCAGMMCLSSIEGVSAAQKPTGYHSIDLNIKSPDIKQENKTYARSSAGYYNSVDLGIVTPVKNQEIPNFAGHLVWHH